MRTLSNKVCVAGGITSGINPEHCIRIGWTKGVFSLAFCCKCGRWRSAKGKGLTGRCDLDTAQATRVRRAQNGKNPVTGTFFDRISVWKPPAVRTGEGFLLGGTADLGEVLARAAVSNSLGEPGPRGLPGCGFDIGDHDFVDEAHDDDGCECPPELADHDDEPW